MLPAIRSCRLTSSSFSFTHRRTLTLPLAYLIFIGTLACSSRAGGPEPVDDVIPADVTLDTLFAIGAPDGPEDELIWRDQRGGSVLLDVGPDGLIWIMNSGDKRLIVFNADGERQTFLGRSGEGPGEFQWVLGLTAVEGGAWTWDWRNQQLCRWSVEEGLLNTYRTEIPQPMFNRMTIDENGTIWYLHEHLEEPEYKEIPVELVRVSPGEEAVVVTTFIVPGAILPRRGGAMSLVPHIVPAPRGGILIAPGYEYELQWYTVKSNTPRRVWEYPSTETPYSARQLRPGGRGGFTPAGGDMVEPPLLPHKPDIEALFPMGEAGFWIMTPVRNDQALARFDQIERNGSRQASYWLPRRLFSARYHNLLLYALSYTPDGYQVLAIRLNK